MMPRMIDEYAAHQLSSNAEKLRAVLPLGVPLIDQLQIGFINQRRRLQSVARPFASQVVMVRTMTVIGKAQDSATLIFRRYGSRYFFAQAWVDGENSGLQAPKSRAERTIERELAGIKPKTATVALRVR